MTSAYDPLLWHDNALYGVRFVIGDPARDDWRSDLELDIDHILEWLKAENGRMRFRVVPASLTFHDVCDPNLSLDWGDSGLQTALNPASIDRIERAQQDPAAQKICLDRPYCRWQVQFNWPRAGAIAFGASGFSLRLRAEARLSDEQSLPPGERCDS
ncbi:MAG: hypothetical protein AAF495_11810 [Pseudomonadota bacterium]